MHTTLPRSHPLAAINSRLTGALVGTALLLSASSELFAAPIALLDYAVFGANDITTGHSFTVTGGLIGSDHDIQLWSTAYNNGIRAGGNVSLGAAGANIEGNVIANGSMALPGWSAISGNVSYGTTLTGGHNTTVAGTTTQDLMGYESLVFPEATTFTPGTDNFTTNTPGTNVTLAPGSYRDIGLIHNTTLTLTAGNYYMNRFSVGGSGGGLNLVFDVTNGPINIFSAGTFGLGFNAETTVVGGTAADVFLEVHDYINLTGNFFGTVFSPVHPIVLGHGTHIEGALYSGMRVSAGDRSSVNFVPSNYLAASAVPVPAAVWLFISGLSVLGIKARRRNLA